MKTPVKRIVKQRRIRRSFVRTTLVHMLMNQCPTKIGSKVTAKKSNHDERIKQLQQRLDSSEELSKW
jgi:hypothetical protein